MKAFYFFKKSLLLGLLLLVFPSFGAITYIVDTKTDVDDNMPAAAGTNSLRKCIRLANTSAGPDIINFSATGTGTIVLGGQQLFISDPVLIDGTSGAGYTSGKPVIEISQTGSQIVIQIANTGGGTTLNALVLNSGFNGIQVETGADNNVITGCFIGTNLSGLAAKPNTNGMQISSSNNTIGGNTAALRNIVCASSNNGIQFMAGTKNTISGNYIGVGADGATALGNTREGINFAAATSNNIVGGNTPAEGNVISNCGADALHFQGNSSSNTIAGNYIGVTASGTTAAPNAGSGIDFNSAAGNNSNIIGSLTNKNVISNNKGNGIFISGGDKNQIIGNYIGTDASGLNPMGNFYGMDIIAGTNTLISNNIVAASFSSNTGQDAIAHGIYIEKGSSFTKVTGNMVGVDKNGSGTNLGNHGNGITVVSNSLNCIIGGLNPGDGNIVSGNGYGGNGAGVSLSAGSDNVQVIANTIGLNADKTTANGNFHFGIWSSGCNGLLISQNYIAYSTMNGVHLGTSTGAKITDNYIFGSTIDGLDFSTATMVTLWRNKIGLDQNGVSKPNGGNGINFNTNSSNSLIGDTALGNINIIANNVGNGISISGASTKIAIHKNSIYCNKQRGIELNAGTGNSGYAAPVLDPNISNTVVFGTAPFNAFVEIFSTGPAPCATCSPGLNTIQGKTYINTVQADNTGKWSYTPGSPFTSGVAVTASETVSGIGNTSEFAVCPSNCAAPVFTSQPSGAHVCNAGTITLTAAASGATKYKWQQKIGNGAFTDIADGGVYAGSGTSSLQLTGITLSMNNYVFQNVAYAGSCSVNSNSFTLLVDSSSAVGTISSGSSRICSGKNVSFSLAGSVGGIVWQSSPDSATWNTIAGETTKQLNVLNLNSTAFYRVLVKDGVCSAVPSKGIKVKVDPALVVTQQASNSTVCNAGNAIFSTKISNANTYKWQEKTSGGVFKDITDNALYGGAATATLTLTNVNIAMSGNMYECIASIDGNCSITTNPVSLTVNSSIVAGKITATAARLCMNSADTLTLAPAAGTFQWETVQDTTKPWNAIAGATAAQLILPAVTQNGYYHVIISSGTCTPVQTRPFLIGVDAPVTITAAPAPVEICEGIGTSFSVVATGATSYQWQAKTSGNFSPLTDGPLYSGTNGSSLNLTKVPAALTGTTYNCIIKNGTCSSTSGSAALTVDAAPVAGSITGPLTICQGQGNNTYTLSNQQGQIAWQSSIDGVNYTTIGGATAASYQAGAITKTMFYRAQLSSGVCSAVPTNSVKTTLKVARPGSVQISNPSACYGTTVNLSLKNYAGSIVKWQSSVDTTVYGNWKDLGSNDTSLNVNALQKQYYRALVNNTCSTDSSKTALLSILTVVPFSLGPDTTVCTPYEILLKAPTTYASYTWSDDEKTNVIRVKTPGLYWVEVKAANACTFRDSILIKPCSKTVFYDVISPNGDGKNEVFVIVGLEANSSLQIYNRWGTLLREFNPYNNDWDGSGVSDGAYFYLCKSPSSPTVAGVVEVVR